MQNSAVLSCALSYALFHFYFTSNTNSYNKTVQFSFILHCFCKSYFFFPSTFLKVEVNFSLQQKILCRFQTDRKGKDRPVFQQHFIRDGISDRNRENSAQQSRQNCPPASGTAVPESVLLFRSLFLRGHTLRGFSCHTFFLSVFRSGHNQSITAVKSSTVRHCVQ